MELLRWYGWEIAEVVRGLVDAPSEVVGLLRRSFCDSVVVLRGDWAWVKRGMEDSGLVYRVPYRTVGFRELLDQLSAAVALREGYLAGSEVRVVTGGGEERSFNADSEREKPV